MKIFHDKEKKRRENKEKMDGSDRVSLTNRVRVDEGPAEFRLRTFLVFLFQKLRYVEKGPNSQKQAEHWKRKKEKKE